MTRIVTKSTLWRYSGDKASWIFATLDEGSRKRIDALKVPRKGWGSIKVRAAIGKTSWETSIFPDKRAGWVLPIKAAVRKKESVGAGDEVRIGLTVA